MLVIWHAVIFQIILAIKVFEESIINIDIDTVNNVIAVGNCYSEIKIFRI